MSLWTKYLSKTIERSFKLLYCEYMIITFPVTLFSLNKYGYMLSEHGMYKILLVVYNISKTDMYCHIKTKSESVSNIKITNLTGKQKPYYIKREEL